MRPPLAPSSMRRESGRVSQKALVTSSGSACTMRMASTQPSTTRPSDTASSARASESASVSVSTAKAAASIAAHAATSHRWARRSVIDWWRTSVMVFRACLSRAGSWSAAS